MLNHWITSLTSDIIERSKEGSKDAKETLFKLVTIITDEKAGRYETAIRAWATHDNMARAILQKVDQQRLEHITRGAHSI